MRVIFVARIVCIVVSYVSFASCVSCASCIMHNVCSKQCIHMVHSIQGVPTE